MEALVFYTLAAVTLVSALGVVFLRNTLHCALMLGITLAGVAGIFASLGADFLFAGQILIYVTGVAVLVLFVVMLAGRHSELHMRQVNDQWLAGLLICGVTFWGLWRYVALYGSTTATGTPRPTTALLGELLLGRFAVPFELISLVLVVALVGAILFSRAEEEGEGAE